MIENFANPIDTQNKISSPQEAFMKFQCRARQMIMRDNLGRPDDSITPNIYLKGNAEPITKIITLMHKLPEYAALSELMHIARKTNDPSQRRDQAVKLLSASYYQKHREFTDVLTATFAPNSNLAETLISEGRCRLLFDAYSHKFESTFAVNKLERSEFLFRSTVMHNQLFNPNLHPETIILSFSPGWEEN
ncbi:MAG: hypothetical protein P8L82_09670 [Paracoccaceae bacterium]|nr:hypothetical protein [Paracoccaceae bacterium]